MVYCARVAGQHGRAEFSVSWKLPPRNVGHHAPMIPLKDDAPRITTPYITYFLIIANTLVFLFQSMLGRESGQLFVYQFGLVPANVVGWLTGIVQVPAEMVFLPILTSMFLHGSLPHLVFNMWALWIFGDNVEDHL